MKRTAAVLASIVAALVGASTASADQTASPMNFPFTATCSGIGQVTLNQTLPAHTEAFLVEGTNTVVLIPLNNASGIIRLAEAAGTTCDLSELGFPEPVPALIIRG